MPDDDKIQGYTIETMPANTRAGDHDVTAVIRGVAIYSTITGGYVAAVMGETADGKSVAILLTDSEDFAAIAAAGQDLRRRMS